MNMFSSFFQACFAFVIILGILIFVHEFGHFITAKLFGVRVLKFSLGFGARIFSKKWGETEYVLSAFPLGGYVKMYGEEGGQKIPPEEETRSFSHKSAWQRFLIVFAGPCFNLIFAVVVLFCLYMAVGVPQEGKMDESGKIGQVLAETPAEQAGLRVNDIIVAIDGQKITTWQQIPQMVQKSGGKVLAVEILRDGQLLHKNIAPKMLPQRNLFGEKLGESTYMMGISPSIVASYAQASIGQCAWAALENTWWFTQLNFRFLGKMLKGTVSARENIGGPVRIAEVAGQQMRSGMKEFVNFLAMISICLGVLNLLPIPVLDGGHLSFLFVEIMSGGPVSERFMDISQKIGIVLLSALMIFAFYNDIVHVYKKISSSNQVSCESLDSGH